MVLVPTMDKWIKLIQRGNSPGVIPDADHPKV